MDTATQSTATTPAAPAGISWAKLRTGDWGVRGPASLLAPGRSVEVTRKDGETRTATIDRVVWTDGTITLCSVARQARQASGRSYGGRRRASCDCSDGCCDNGCRCDATCNCRGGNIYDC